MMNIRITDTSNLKRLLSSFCNKIKNHSVQEAKNGSESSKKDRNDKMSLSLMRGTAFLAGLLIALCLCRMGESLIMARALDARMNLAEKISTRSPSFANSNLNAELASLTEQNPFKADIPAQSDDIRQTAYPISSLMLAGTLPKVGAWIRDDSGTSLILKGQEIRGYKLEDISYGKILLSNGGESYPLYLVLSGGNTVAPPPPAANAGKKSDLDMSAIVAAGDGKEGSVPRELVDKLLMNPYDEIAKMRMVPHEGGGMQLERIAPDSVLGVVGVAQGDVIKALNGVNITNMGDIANAVNSLMAGTRFDVTVNRGGKPLELKYQVK